LVSKSITTIKIETSLEHPKNFFKKFEKFQFFLLSNYFNCVDANERFVVFSFSEFNESVGESEQSEIFSDANIFSGMVLCATLTDDDVAGNGRLATKDLNAEALAV